MKPIARTPLSEIRAKEEETKAKDAQLHSLGISISQEKIKNIQKDTMLNQLGQEVAQLKVEIMTLKGAVN